MKTIEKKMVLEFLNEVKGIMDKKDETEFAELGKTTRIEISKLFFERFDAETDGDSDACYAIVEIKPLRMEIWSHSEYCSEESIAQFSYDFSFRGDVEIRNINEMIKYVEGIDPKDEVVALLNTSIITIDGNYSCKTISLDDVKSIIDGAVLDSAIGHDSTAKIMTDLLGVDVPVNRQQFMQNVGQRAIVFKLRGRAPEGIILSLQEIEKIGYDFKLLMRTA